MRKRKRDSWRDRRAERRYSGAANGAASRRDGTPGFTLLELMVVVAVIALIAALALPAYDGYMQTSREGVLTANIGGMEVFQEDHRLRTGAYLQTAPDAAAIANAIGWRPQANDGAAYSIAPGSNASYRVTATSPDGTQICLQLPERTRC